MLNIGHVICLYAGVVLGWFLASLCFIAKGEENVANVQNEKSDKT